ISNINLRVDLPLVHSVFHARKFPVHNRSHTLSRGSISISSFFSIIRISPSISIVLSSDISLYWPQKPE
ncbi:hypothetical protein CROQUDRAFT_653964, partial [Cronartium quercuum f. sp. fusiforme G11]